MSALLIVSGFALLFYLMHRTHGQMGGYAAHHGEGPTSRAGQPATGDARQATAPRKMSMGALLLLILLLTLPLMLLHAAVDAGTPVHGVLFWPALLLAVVILSYLWAAGRLPGSKGPPAPFEAEAGAEEAIRQQRERREVVERMRERVAPDMDVECTGFVEPVVVFEGRLKGEPDSAYRRLSERFVNSGRTPVLLEAEHGRTRILAVPGFLGQRGRARTQLGVPLLLFLATLATTVWAGAAQQGVNLWREPGRFPIGVPYAFALLGILLVHELGHYLAARRHGISVTLPYFIPVPMGLGTFGAFIQIRGAIPDRRKLFDVGVAGPLAGLAVAVPALYFGIKGAEIAPSGPGVNLASSVLLAWVYGLANGGPVPLDHVVRLTPIGFAGWLGLLITALNLVPVGQLDGGHVAYALFGRRRAETVGWVTFFLLIALGMFYWSGWLNWALLIFFLGGVKHEPALNELSTPGRGRRIIGALAFVLLFLIMAPVPHRFMGALGIKCPYA